MVPGRKIYVEAIKFGKKIYVIGDSHLSRMKRNIFQKPVKGGETYFNASQGATSKRLNNYQLFTKMNLMLFCYMSVLMIKIIKRKIG